jgi:hypothetical protein
MKKVIYISAYFICSCLNDLHDEIKKINPFYSIIRLIYKKEKLKSHIKKSDNYMKDYNLIRAEGIIYVLISCFVFGFALFSNHYFNFNIEFKLLFLGSFLFTIVVMYTSFDFASEYLDYKKDLLTLNKNEMRNKYTQSVYFIISLIIPPLLWIIFQFSFVE